VAAPMTHPATTAKASAQPPAGSTGDDSATLGDLLTLATTLRARLSDLEWRIVLLVLAAPEPLSAREIARRLRGPSGAAQIYSSTKRGVRRLIAWGLIDRTEAGLWVEVNPRHWKPEARVRRAIANRGRLWTPARVRSNCER
jgi:hypothetical protein